jgi:hypothetical protein
MSPLKPLHPESSLSSAKLIRFRGWSVQALVDSLKPGQPEALRVRPDGTIVNGHHRNKVLREQGIDVDSLPREVVLKDEPPGR